jgi:hypothetical protein
MDAFSSGRITARQLPRFDSPLKTLAGLLLLVPFVVVPLVALWYAGPDVLAEHAVLERYKAVDAVVVSAEVERVPGHAVAYVPRVVFEYAVQGRVHRGERLTPRDVPGTLRWARKHVAGYRAGAHVTAYYDPRDPGRAFLQRRGAPALTATFFLPVPLLTLAFWLAASARIKRARRGLPPPFSSAEVAAH